MQVFGVFDRYIGKTILNTIIITLFILVSLSDIIKFVDQLKKAGQGGYDTISAGIYTFLSTPKDIQIFFPMATLLGALVGLGKLAQYNELIVMQASGYTRMQLAISVMKTTIPLILIIMTISEWLSPHSERMALNYRARAIYGGSMLSTKQGLWIKDNKNFVHIEHVRGNNTLSGVSIYTFNEKHCLQLIRHAATAKFDSRHRVWHLSQVDKSNLQDLKQITNLHIVSDIWETNLTPDKLGIVVMDPDALSISGLYYYINYLKLSGQDYSRYQIKLWSQIFQPISIIVMMLLAISFIFGPMNNKSMGLRVITGISFGFVFYIIDQISNQLAIVYGIPSIIGALLPSTLFFFTSLWFLLKRF